MAATMATSFVLLATVCLGVHSQPDSDICTLHGPTVGPPLPVLPDQYMLRVEANILGWNFTTEVVEFYDGINNRGAVSNVRHGSVSQTVMSYETREIFHVGADGSCRVQNLTYNGFNIFGFKLENGTAHIGNVNDLFRFGAKYNETFMGQTIVRGIPANHWQSCLYQEEANSTSMLDYYFTVPWYAGAFGDSEVPLRLALNGRASNHKFINGKPVQVNGTHNYSHVYEFFDVQYNPDFADRTFEPRLGVVCPGRKSPKPFPLFPERFSVDVEKVSSDFKRVFFARETYDYKSKMAGFFYTMTRESKTPTPYYSLDDFNTGLTYRINLNNGSCNITPISLRSPEAFSQDNAHVQIKDSASFFHLGKQDWQYQGMTKLREIETESWIAEIKNYTSSSMFRDGPANLTLEFHFSSATWDTESGLQNSSSMPVMTKYFWTGRKNGTGESFNGSFIINYFHFQANNLSNFHFDIAPCFDNHDSKELAFDVADRGDFKYILNNTLEFYQGARYSIADAAGVTPIRIAEMFVTQGSGGDITIFFKLIGIPWVKGDAVNMTKQLPLEDAYTMLETAIDSGKLTLKFKHRGEVVSVSAKPQSLRTDFAPTHQQFGFSIGAFVGFGVAMLVVGAALSACVLLAMRKKMGDSSVPYNVQS